MNPPRPSLLDRDFRYTKAAETDIRKLFARVKREQKQAGQDNVRALVPKAKR